MLGAGVAADPIQADVTPTADVAWLVIGVAPPTARLEIDEPAIKDGMIWSFKYRLQMYRPVDGFILVKVEPGKNYGVAASSLMAGNSIFGIRYKPCGQFPMFKADAGKVVYITSMNYRPTGMTSGAGVMNFAEGVAYSQDLQGARAFLAAHYPGLAPALEQGSYEMTPIVHQCR